MVDIIKGVGSDAEPLVLAGVKVLLEGPTGTGKTRALGTFVDWCQARGYKAHALFVEHGLETLLGYWVDQKKPIPECLSWHNSFTKPLSFTQLMDGATKVGQLSYEALTKLQDPTRSQNNAFLEVLKSCNNFPDDRTGAKHGPVDSWDHTHVFMLDSLTELANAACKMVIGNKPTMAPPDYGVAQNNLMNFLRLITQGCRCHFVLTAHMGREKDEISGGIKLMTQAIGSAISSQIPPMFSDVIMTVREGNNWYWDTISTSADLKTRNLPYAAKITPDFAQVMEKWKARAEAK